MAAVMREPLAVGVPPIEAIVRLAERVPVFPCRRHPSQVNGRLLKPKSPLTPNGLHDATQDPEQVRAWWNRWPDALVGVPTGEITGLAVVDYDSHKADEHAQAFIQQHSDDLLASRSHQTLNGGRHYLFRIPQGHKYRSGANVMLGGIQRGGIDIRAEGGYIIWWPLHGAMATGELAPLPAGLIDERRIEQRELEPLPVATPEAWARDAHRVADALAYLDPQDYDGWIACGMALHFASAGADAGFSLWHSWSSGGLTGALPHNYSGLEDCRYRWESFGGNSSRPVTLGTIFAAAKAKGFQAARTDPVPPPYESPPIDVYAAELDAPASPQPAASVKDKPARTPLDWEALDSQHPTPRDWAIDHWLPMNQPALLAGKGGLGKTLLAQTMATCMAIAYEYFDLVPQPRRVLFWGGEDEHDELWRRQIAICGWLGIPLAALKGKLILESYFARDITLADAAYGALGQTPMMTELRDQIGDYKADYVILDSTARIFGGNENDRHQVTTFISWLSAAAQVNKAGLCLIGHPGKNEGSEYSGSTAWEGSVRSRLYLSSKLPGKEPKAGEEEEENSGTENDRYLSRRKANYAAQDWRKLTYDRGVLIPDNVQRKVFRRTVSPEFGQETVARAVRALKAMNLFGVPATASPSYLPRLAQQYDMLEDLSPKVFGLRMRELMKAGRLKSAQVGQYSNRTPRMGLVEG